MKVEETSLPGVLIVKVNAHGDDRGFFMETWNAREFAAAGIDVPFVQDNYSRSARHTLRGLHYQSPPHAQAKLVRCGRGALYDVAVDIRAGSPTYGAWVATPRQPLPGGAGAACRSISIRRSRAICIVSMCPGRMWE